MKKSFVFPLIIFMFVMSGCKLEHSSRIKQSQLASEIKTVDATVRVEVPSCTDYKDKTKPSQDLIKTTDLMKRLFPSSEYEGCKNENMNSMATYITPMEVGVLPPDAENYDPKGIAIIRNQDGIVFFCLSKEIRAQIANGRKNPMTNNLALNVNIRLNNDTEKDSKIFPYAVFADGIAFAGLPEWKNSITVKPKESIVFSLSNVASEFAIAQGVVPVFNEPVATSEGDKK